MGRLFGTDGVRGIANTELTCELAMKIGRAAAEVLADGCRHRPTFVIGSDTRAFAWLRDNAHLYGFILRYPEDKVGITEYDYEPWHYRFVGRDAAVAIYKSGLCLEEYLELN